LFVDVADYATTKKLVMRLVFSRPDVATHLMRLGCRPGYAKAVAKASAGRTNARTPAKPAADEQAYKNPAAIARYAEL